MKKIASGVPYILLFLFIGIFVVLGFSYSSNDFSITMPDTQYLEGFVYQGEVLDAYPTEVDVAPNEFYELKVVLPTSFMEKQTLLFRTSLQDIFVYLDGLLIYQMDYQEEANYASMWHFVTLERDASGKTLQVTYRSPYQQMTGVVNPVMYGEQGSLVKEIFSAYSYRLVIGLLTVFVGFVLMIASLFIYRKQSTENMYLGLFAIVIGSWMVSESRLLQLFTGNVFVIGSISYVALALLTIPLFLYLSFHIQKKFHIYLYVLIGVFTVWAPTIIVLDLLNHYGYFESIMVTQVLLFISMAIAITILLIERIKYKNAATNVVINYLLVFSFFGLLELVTFIRSDFDHTSYFMVIGVAIVMLMVSYNYILFVIERFKMSYENDFYEFLAYHDPITGAKNRLAYEQDFDQFFEDEELLETLRLLYFDLDDLKHINDLYGHLEGDLVIKEGHQIIEDVFGGYGTVYRIGGDEFACIVTSLDQKTYQDLVELFKQIVAKTNQNKAYHFGLSIGSSIYDETDTMPEDLVLRADKEMYTYKEQTKKARENESK